MYLDKNGLNVIIKVSRNAKGIEGTSNLMKADREQPVGGKAHCGRQMNTSPEPYQGT